VSRPRNRPPTVSADYVSRKTSIEARATAGVPLLYELDDKLEKVSSRYLGDQEAIRKAAEEVKRQTEGKR
jgi:hypothetical protein